jgi:hypothetical protein
LNDTKKGGGNGLEEKFFLDFINFLGYLFFTMFGALFRPGYNIITSLSSLCFVTSGLIIG